MLFQAIISVTGRVQGVGFRFFTRDAAQSLPGITGFVKNSWDSRVVEVEAEGDREVLERFVALLREGPALSHVADVSARWNQIERRRYDDFTIGY